MSVAVEEERSSTIKKIKYSWVSAADGTATGATTEAYSGEILGFTADPAAAGDQPTDQYDITVTDEAGIDVLMGTGTNMSNASNEQVQGPLGCVANDKLTLNVSNAGNTKQGTVYVYIR